MVKAFIKYFLCLGILLALGYGLSTEACQKTDPCSAVSEGLNYTLSGAVQEVAGIIFSTSSSSGKENAVLEIFAIEFEEEDNQSVFSAGGKLLPLGDTFPASGYLFQYTNEFLPQYRELYFSALYKRFGVFRL